MRLATRHVIFAILSSSCVLFTTAAGSEPSILAKNELVLQDVKTLRSATPFQNNNGAVPPKDDYAGPLFNLSHDWPARPLAPLAHTPWQAAIDDGPINPQNAPAYANALKEAVAANARNLLMHYDTWDAAKAGWYNEPWMGTAREAIHGTYFAGQFGPSIFPGTGLTVPFATHVLTYYDARAASTLRKVWGDTAMSPDLTADSTQFAEGSIIVKAAIFASTDASKPLGWWDAMDGAQVWELYTTPTRRSETAVSVLPGYVAQFDIIVKDSRSAPTTGWVFMTLVYDKSASGDYWDKMVPLGVQWGNDPQAAEAGMPLTENWINPNSPAYSRLTLGWGGRLSGPNDGATNDIAVNGQVMPNFPNSSCMSCHSTAEWNVGEKQFPIALIPSMPPSGEINCDANGKPVAPGADGPNVCSPVPGSATWMTWFQNRPGTDPLDPSSTATDFDLVLSFQSLRGWSAATSGPNLDLQQLRLVLPRQRNFNSYNGAPLRVD